MLEISQRSRGKQPGAGAGSVSCWKQLSETQGKSIRKAIFLPQAWYIMTGKFWVEKVVSRRLRTAEAAALRAAFPARTQLCRGSHGGLVAQCDGNGMVSSEGMKDGA